MDLLDLINLPNSSVADITKTKYNRVYITNKKAKVLKRHYYGIFNIKHFFQKLDLDILGYQLFSAGSAC